MKKTNLSAIFNLPPKEAIDYLKQKELKITFDYKELWGEAHQRAFSVAKVMKLDLLNDIHNSLQDALKEGKSFKEWQKELKPTLIKKGWYGKQEIFNPQTGEFKTININARRLNTIYETNIRSAYNFGRYKHLKDSKIPYWMYVSALLPTTRPTHAAMHGKVYPASHPFWNANYPPNGYNCKCKVRGYTKKQLQKRNITPSKEYENIADPGFTYKPNIQVLENIHKQKIDNAPKWLKFLATKEQKIITAYDNAFKNTELEDIIKRNKPNIKYNKILRNTSLGRYYPNSQTIEFPNIPTKDVIYHETAHHLDNLMHKISQELYHTIIIDVSLWDDTIMQDIKPYKNDPILSDLIYLSSKGKFGYVKTREPKYITDERVASEAFANILTIYLQNDKRLEIVKKYFKNSYNIFLKIYKQLKDTL